ncbi:hypothetical protein pipiens_010955, partial [Culex pipiens pipiens]
IKVSVLPDGAVPVRREAHLLLKGSSGGAGKEHEN